MSADGECGTCSLPGDCHTEMCADHAALQQRYQDVFQRFKLCATHDELLTRLDRLFALDKEALERKEKLDQYESALRALPKVEDAEELSAELMVNDKYDKAIKDLLTLARQVQR